MLSVIMLSVITPSVVMLSVVVSVSNELKHIYRMRIRRVKKEPRHSVEGHSAEQHSAKCTPPINKSNTILHSTNCHSDDFCYINVILINVCQMNVNRLNVILPNS